MTTNLDLNGLFVRPSWVSEPPKAAGLYWVFNTRYQRAMTVTIPTAGVVAGPGVLYWSEPIALAPLPPQARKDP